MGDEVNLEQANSGTISFTLGNGSDLGHGRTRREARTEARVRA